LTTNPISTKAVVSPNSLTIKKQIKMKKINYFLITFLLTSFCSNAQMMIPASLTQRVKNAQTMALGKVIEKQCYWDVAHHNIWTLNIMEVRVYLKTNFSDLPTQIAIITSGGIVGNQAQQTCPSYDFQLQNEYLVFLDANNKQIDDKAYRLTHPNTPQCEPYASVQGVLAYVDGKYYDAMSEPPHTERELLNKLNQEYGLISSQPNGKTFTPREAPQAAALLGTITSWIDGSGSGPFIGATLTTANRLTINGTGFGATAGTVEFDHVDDGLGIGSSGYTTTISTDIISWSNTQIVTQIPSKAGTGIFRVKDNTATVVATSASNINIKWSQINVENIFLNFSAITRQQVKFINQDAAGGYTFQYSTVTAGSNTFSTNTAAKASFERALVNWRCATFVNFKVSATTTSVGPAADGINSVSFNPALAANVLGSCITRFGGQGLTGTCELLNTLWYVSELDVQMSPDGATFGWNYGPGATAGTNKVDFESVMLHEIGHGHGCDHINDATKAMNWQISTNVDKRVLVADEIACANNRLSNSTSAFCVSALGGGKQPMTLLTSCVLAVELLSFDATNKADKNLLNWQTASEINNSHFLIQKSKDGQNFVDIGTVKGHGTTTTPQYYDFVDEKPFLGINYYRLKQVDNDGKAEFSKTVSVNWLKEGKQTLSLYPNPTHNILTVEHTPSVKTIEIVNTLGQIVKLVNPTLEATQTDIPTADLSNGVYFLRVNQTEMVRFVKF
jgi:hypothetical protein